MSAQLPLLPPPRDVLADARAVAERHRASVRALWGAR
jgi:hypothetical protein